MRDERGAGSVLVVAILGATMLLFMLSAPLYRGIANKHVAAGAADAAAVAAADVARGIVPGSPCEQAGVVAAANGSVLSGCIIDGVVATVTVQAGSAALSAAVTATAGPPALDAD
jgi:secretion/DNA translocation related TadE-like protein